MTVQTARLIGWVAFTVGTLGVIACIWAVVTA